MALYFNPDNYPIDELDLGTDLTDCMTVYDEEDPFMIECPLCGCENVVETGDNYEDFGSVHIVGYRCPVCRSTFSFTYWIHSTVICKDNRKDITRRN